MILVTGAAGKTGQSIIRALTASRKSIRALVHKDSQVQLMKALGVHNVIVGDMRSREVLKKTFPLDNVERFLDIVTVCPLIE